MLVTSMTTRDTLLQVLARCYDAHRSAVMEVAHTSSLDKVYNMITFIPIKHIEFLPTKTKYNDTNKMTVCTVATL